MKFPVVLAFALFACDKGRELPPPKPLPAPAPAPDAAVVQSDCKLSEVTLRYPQPGRVVAIGDVHGDLAATRAALRTAGAIDEQDRWIGGELVVVQTGDVLDRGDDEQAILDLLGKLEGEAKAAGGAMILLLGNHELMNAAGDFRYVTPGAMADFDDVAGLDTSKYAKAPERVRKRIAALGPGGPYAKKLAQHNVIAIVGDTVYSHAGVIGEWATQVDLANRSARCWLDGQAGGVDAPPGVLVSDQSPMWTRAYGLDPVDCAAAKATLAALGVKRMVVGHTVQKTGINAACDGTVWRIDVGMAKAYGGPIEVLELAGGNTKVLRGTR